MTEQLFNDYGYVKPTSTHRKDGRRQPQPCAVEGCTNPRRNVQAAKYCEEHATCINGQMTGSGPIEAHGTCLVCDAVVVVGAATYAGARTPIFLCVTHHRYRSIAKRMRQHHLDDERTRQWLRAPRCWIDGESLTWRLRGDGRSDIDIDHDPACCEGEVSCGRCIRGLTHHRCNVQVGAVAGMLERLGSDRTDAVIRQLIEFRAALD